MRYILSVAQHLFTGKLTFAHALYALRVRPIAVVSKGKTWVIKPDFRGWRQRPCQLAGTGR
ncbi:hypothetical protein SSTU70S_04924 [Stutzerimonas stutzeri]